MEVTLEGLGFRDPVESTLLLTASIIHRNMKSANCGRVD